MRHWLLAPAIAVGCGGDDDGRMNTATSLTTTMTTTVGTGSTSDDETGTSNQPDTTSTTEPQDTSSEAGSASESGPPPVGSACTYTCSVAADCLADGMTFGHTCQTGKCVIPCSNPDGCVAYYSGWLIEPCTSSDDCEFNTCVTYGDGNSGCAFTPELGECAELGLVNTERMTVEGDMVTVCAEPDATCMDLGAGMECVVPCTEFVECYMSMTGEVCTPEGECVYDCAEAADCPASNFDNVVATCE